MAAAAAALVTVVFWASAFVGIRSAGRVFSPGALSLGRLVVGLVALVAVSLVRREELPSRDALRAVAAPLLVAGVLWFGAYNLMLNSAERRVDAGTAAMLVNVGPILIAILAGLLLAEGFPRTLFAGFFLPFVPQLVRQAGAAPTGSLAWIVYLGVFPTAVGFVTWAFALSRTDAGRLGATTYLVPPLSILFGWLWLGESPAALAYLGGALCLAGVALSRARRVSLPLLVRSRRGRPDRPSARDQHRAAEPDPDAGAARGAR